MGRIFLDIYDELLLDKDSSKDTYGIGFWYNSQKMFL